MITLTTVQDSQTDRKIMGCVISRWRYENDEDIKPTITDDDDDDDDDDIGNVKDNEKDIRNVFKIVHDRL